MESRTVNMLLIVLAYIVQVLLMLAYPYYKYRQNYKDRTIGGLLKFTYDTKTEAYLVTTFFPFLGPMAFLFIMTLYYIAIGVQIFYNKYIKNIRI